MPAAIDMCIEMITEKVAHQLKHILFSDNIRRILLIGNDFVSDTNRKFFITVRLEYWYCKQKFCCYVRYFYINKIYDDKMFSSKLEITTIGKNLF